MFAKLIFRLYEPPNFYKIYLFIFDKNKSAYKDEVRIII
jgi:hypothetical protein